MQGRADTLLDVLNLCLSTLGRDECNSWQPTIGIHPETFDGQRVSRVLLKTIDDVQRSFFWHELITKKSFDNAMIPASFHGFGNLINPPVDPDGWIATIGDSGHYEYTNQATDTISYYIKYNGSVWQLNSKQYFGEVSIGDYLAYSPVTELTIPDGRTATWETVQTGVNISVVGTHNPDFYYYDGVFNKYSLPNDCIRPMGVKSLPNTDLPSTIFTLDDKNNYTVESNYLLTVDSKFDFVYIRRSDIPSEWTSELLDCIVKKAAADSCMMVLEDKAFRRELIKEYEQLTSSDAKRLQSKYKTNYSRYLPSGFISL